MQDSSVGFSVAAANPALRCEAVTKWLHSDQSPAVSLPDTHLREMPRSPDDPPTIARFNRPRARVPTRLAVMSDIHLSTRRSGSWKLHHRTTRRLRTAVQDIQSRRIDGVVVAGDLTADGHPDDVRRVEEILTDLSTQVLAVPGNHDVSPDGHDSEPFQSESGKNSVLPNTLPYHARVGGLDLLCVDSTRAASGTKATVSADQLQWLEAAIGQVDEPVVVSHHNLPGLLAATGGQSWRSSFPLQNAGSLSHALHGTVPLHISGHLHLPAVAATRGTRELISPALCSFPGGYLLLDVGPHGTTIRFVPVVDLPGLRDGWRAAREYKQRSRMIAWMAHRQLTELPFVDEHMPTNRKSYGTAKTD